MTSRPRLRDLRREPAFERFVGDSSTSLLRTAYLLTGELGAAEDVLQVTLLRTAAHWRSARQAPEAYARRVLVNVARDRSRRAARRVTERPLEEQAIPRSYALSRDHAEGVGGRDEVIKALARLPFEQREVLVLRFFADLSVAETAAVTGTSEGTVKSRTSRALARMRAFLAGPVAASAQPPSVEVADDH